MCVRGCGGLQPPSLPHEAPSTLLRTAPSAAVHPARSLRHPPLLPRTCVPGKFNLLLDLFTISLRCRHLLVHKKSSHACCYFTTPLKNTTDLARVSRDHSSSSMALTRRSLLVVVATLLLQLFLAGPAAAEGKTGQLTVFWGRHKDEGSLREACDSGRYTMVIMSFLSVDGGGGGGHGKYRLDLSGHPLRGIGGDIKHCQRKGVLVSLAIGGPGGAFSLPTNQSALDLFDHLWNSYLGGSRKGVLRPFGDARLDGVDFFLKRATPAAGGYDVLAGELAKRRNQLGSGPGSRPLLLTATTPFCAAPAGRGVGGVLAADTFERIHVRFYDGSDCAATDSWENTWNEWAAAYPHSQIYLGLLASEQAGKSGYIYFKTVYYGVLPLVQRAANYGGVMLWDLRCTDTRYGRLDLDLELHRRWAPDPGDGGMGVTSQNRI
ncbi:hypothetical protein GUJ93_ZPchr0007g5881 [Zizania palustris]|uniref:GH18 domain-containing protein n=1 Tax=Zizania palustris TaxID=103762 RepID=A0A8J5T4F9_ZIZPA|nr:hypothetical protein GUJ93_ZPchr0007g5881 [Zizania palustris]